MGPSRAIALILATALPATAAAQAPGGAADANALLKAMADCRAVASSDARLACFDAAASRLLAAEQAGEVVVVDRTQARATQRQAFGFSLPSLDIFKRGEPEGALDRVQLTLARAVQGGDGRWLLRTTEGQVWRQTDERRLSRVPRAGSQAEVRGAAVGSFLMNIDGQTAIRVRREQ